MPDFRRCFMSVPRSTGVRVAAGRLTHLSPRRSTTYACTPPGILTSTRTSTRENALKQLQWRQYCSRLCTTCIPVASIPDLPLGCFREPGGVVFDRIGQGVDVCGKRRRRGGVNARNVVVGAELCEGMSSRRFCCTSTRTSFVALFPVLLTTWHRSGGPSSRNVATDASDLAPFRVNCTRT